MSRSIIYTIDVEFSTHAGTMGILGRIGNREYGLFRILDIFDRYLVKTTCFVDVYAYKRVGVQGMKDICGEIAKRGHDVQLHTHPSSLFDKTRVCIGDYTLSEQIEILRTGSDLLLDFSGTKPMAHRAGDWGANADTLAALKHVEMKVDSSFYYRHPQLRFNYAELPCNCIFERDGVIEIAPTVYHAHSLGIFHPFRNLDINFSTGQEFAAVIKKTSCSPLVITLHSFSLLNWNKRRSLYWPNQGAERKLKQFLAKTVHHGLVPMTVQEFMSRDPKLRDCIEPSDAMVTMPPYVTAGRFFSAVSAKLTGRVQSIYFELKNKHVREVQ